MRPDPFEDRLARTPLRPPPAAWRQEILGAAREAAHTTAPRMAPRRWEVGPWWDALARWLAPGTVLAAATGLVLVLSSLNNHLEAHPGDSLAAVAARRSSPAATLAAARHYRAELLALVTRDDGPPPEPPLPTSPTTTPAPAAAPDNRPRSEWSPPQPELRRWILPV